MSRQVALDAVAGVGGEAVFAVSWMPHAAAHALLDPCGRGAADDLADAAEALGVDLAFVSGVEKWAPEAVWKLQDRGVAAGWVVPGPLGLLAGRIGWSAVVRDSLREPRELSASLSKMLSETIGQVERGAEAGADVVIMADELSSGSEWLVSPEFALVACIPCMTRVAEVAREHGMPTVFHSDGDIRVLFDAMHDAGVSGIHVGSIVGRALFEVALAARASGLVTLGGVAARFAVDGEAQRAAAVDLVHLVKRGGLIACDDGGMTTPDDLRALQAVFTEARYILEG